jgi:hypothetical protein
LAGFEVIAEVNAQNRCPVDFECVRIFRQLSDVLYIRRWDSLLKADHDAQTPAFLVSAIPIRLLPSFK